MTIIFPLVIGVICGICWHFEKLRPSVIGLIVAWIAYIVEKVGPV